MRTYAVNSFKVFSVHEECSKFIFIKVKSEKNAETNVIYAAFHCSVHGFGMVSVIVLRSGRMKLFVAFLMVSFLEKNICTNSGFGEFSVVFDSSRCDIYVDSADSAVFMLDTVNSFYRI